MQIADLIAAVLAILSFIADSGGASQYDPGLMERVIANRQGYSQLPADLPAVDGYIAVVDCARLGEVWLVKPVGGSWETMFVADCAGPHLRDDGMTGGEWMLENNVLMEIDHQTALRWNTIGAGIQIKVLRPP